MPDVLAKDAIRLGQKAASKAEALGQCGELLVEIGAATPQYAAALPVRETQVSTYLGEGVAIPHGTDESRQHILRAALGFIQYPEGVDWDGNTVYVAIPIASSSNEHIGILGVLAEVLSNKRSALKLRMTDDPEVVLAMLSEFGDE